MTHALLIDGETISSAHASRLLSVVPPDCAVRRVYGDAARLADWQGIPQLRIVHVPSGGASVAVQLAVDAVALAHGEGVTSFTLGTSEASLAPLVRHLREEGHAIVVMGEADAPATLRAAAHVFIDLPMVTVTPATHPGKRPSLHS